jgi:proteasome accessory factor B
MHSLSDSRTKRLLDLVVLLLDARRPISLAELREQFSEYRTAKPEAGARAFERDKATLLEMGVPLRFVTQEEDSETPAEGGYLIDRQRYRLPEINLTADEVAVLVTTAAAARSQNEFPYRHAAEMAMRKLMFDLSGMSGKPRRRAKTKLAAEAPRGPTGNEVVLHLPTVYRTSALSEHLEQIQDAVHLRKRLTFEYDAHRPGSHAPVPFAAPGNAAVGGDGLPGDSDSDLAATSASEPREVDPYGLVYRQGAWLLVGFCHRAQAIRRFRVDRILKLSVAPKPRTPDFDVPKDFSLHEQGAISPWRFEREPPLRAQLWVSADTPWVADEDFGPAVRSKAEARGRPGTLVEFDCRNPDYVVSRVLSAAGSLVLSSPPALRQRIREAAATLARRNGGALGLPAVPTAQEPA